jgi:hypothetical protein
MKVSLIVLAAFSGIATASPYLSSANGQQETGIDSSTLLGMTITLDLSGVNSWDALGDVDNELMSVQLFSFSQVIGISWDVNISTLNASWLSESVMNLEDELYVTPGIGNDFAGTASFSSGGMIDLIAEGLDFFVSSDGILNIEFFESFDDVDGAIDATFLAGSTIQVRYGYPTPGGLAVLGVGGIFASRRRR